MFKKSNAGDQLLLAVKLNKVAEISRLVALGVNVNSRIDKNGKTALHYAAYKGQLSSVKALIEAGADLDLTDENGVTALHRAVIDGHADVVHALLEGGCSVDKKDENGNTAVHEAAWNGYSKCVEFLATAKCNVNIHNRTGYTSLHLAAQNAHCKTLQVLLKGGANPLAKNNYGDSPLHIAVRYGHVDACKILLGTSQVNISEQNNDGNTALHIATRMGHEKLADMLLKAGSVVTTKNNVGDTARDIAIQNGFKKIAKLLAPSSSDTWRLFRRGRRERPRSVDVSGMFGATTDSTLTTTATQLWVPKPVSEEPVSKKESHKRDGSSHITWRGRKKDEGRVKVLTIKFNEMCSIEREYSNFLKKRNASMRKKSHRSHSRSTLKSLSRSTVKSQERKHCSDPGFHVESKKSNPDVKDENKKSAQSRDDLDVSLSPKKYKKDKGLFAIFRSSSDPDLTCEMKNGTLFGKKHKDKFPPPSREVMGNGVHHRIPEEVIKEKGDVEETKETKEKRKERKEREKGEEKWEKREKSSKKEREEDKGKLEKKERRREKDKEKDRDKEKKHSRRDEKEGSEADYSICQEKIRKSREKAQSKEQSRHRDKEHRSKSEHKRWKEHHDEDAKDRGQRSLDKQDEEKEHRRKKHHHDREKEKEKSRKDKHHDKHHRRRNEEHVTGNEVDFGPIPCNPARCSTCKASLSRLEAWQERCTAEIESARRRLEHRLQRLEKKLEEQQSEERQLQEKESREKEYDRVLGRVTDECREVSKSVKDSSGDVKEEIRGLIKGGLSKLELKLGQISTGYNIPFMDFHDRCNPELGRNCSADRGGRRAVRSRSSPHLGRAPCEECASLLDHRMSPAPTPLSVSGTLTSATSSVVSSRVSSRACVSDAGSMETVIAARPVSEEEVVKVPETILEARPVMDESCHHVNDTYAASQVHHQRQVQEMERWWRNKAEEEQRVLYARICELEQMLTMTRVGAGGTDCFV